MSNRRKPKPSRPHKRPKLEHTHAKAIDDAWESPYMQSVRADIDKHRHSLDQIAENEPWVEATATTLLDECDQNPMRVAVLINRLMCVAEFHPTTAGMVAKFMIVDLLDRDDAVDR